MLWTYAQVAGEIRSDLESSLLPEDVAALRKDLAELGLPGWRKWLQAHEQEANRFLTATPKARAARKAWRDPVLRRRLTLQAIYMASDARALLATLDDWGLLTSGCIRETIGLAADSAARLLVQIGETSIWPLRRPSPFEQG
ncbi:MAG: hypothetical protein NTY01_09325 [Verrucomicrobia bacterium]|nr:hypothetical protein [Verrucomicrobiota bacterium]